MDNYKEILIKKLTRYYDIEEDVSIEHMDFDLMGKFNQKNSKYMLIKEFEYCSFENNEFILYKKVKDEINLDSIMRLLKNHLQEIVTIEDNHMSSVITFILEVSFPLSEKTIKDIKKFKFHKSFRFGLDGWVNAQLIVVNPSQNKGYTNKFARKELDKYLS